ncbi:MAG: mechanosensitive ion channel family protein [Thermoplasmata archaeon]|nr:mechanosensitive ion channel family protein [Thermoplasmata archaeon]
MADENSGLPMATPDRSAPNLRLGVRLVAIFAVGVALYALLVLVSHVFGRINPLYWKALDAGAVLFLAYFVAVLFGTAIRTYLQHIGNFGHVGAVRLVVNILVAMGATAVLLDLFGVSLSSLLVSSAFAGIVIGLAAQTVLANVLAGLLMIVSTPFRVGDRIGVITSSYGALAPTYPHELLYPTYSGVVRNIGLIYTDLALDNGRPAKIPNQVLLGALIVNLSHPSPRSYRVRMTFDQKVPFARVEDALGEYVKAHPPIPGCPEAHLEVTDIGPTTWDGVIVIWSNEVVEEPVRNAVMRIVLAKLPNPPK